MKRNRHPITPAELPPMVGPHEVGRQVISEVFLCVSHHQNVPIQTTTPQGATTTPQGASRRKMPATSKPQVASHKCQCCSAVRHSLWPNSSWLHSFRSDYGVCDDYLKFQKSLESHWDVVVRTTSVALTLRRVKGTHSDDTVSSSKLCSAFQTRIRDAESSTPLAKTASTVFTSTRGTQ